MLAGPIHDKIEDKLNSTSVPVFLKSSYTPNPSAAYEEGIEPLYDDIPGEVRFSRPSIGRLIHMIENEVHFDFKDLNDLEPVIEIIDMYIEKCKEYRSARSDIEEFKDEQVRAEHARAHLVRVADRVHKAIPPAKPIRRHNTLSAIMDRFAPNHSATKARSNTPRPRRSDRNRNRRRGES